MKTIITILSILLGAEIVYHQNKFKIIIIWKKVI